MPETFEIGSALHITSLLVCVAVAVATTSWAHRIRGNETASKKLRFYLGLGCLLSWMLNLGLWLLPSRFSWEESLPLQFCNLANLVSTVALWKKWRLAQSLLYFWAFGLSVWAFLTPSMTEGPALIDFWIFWIYHVFILMAAGYLMVIDRFRPSWKDFGISLAITLSYLGWLTVVNFFTGWNYGFAGRGMPAQPSPIDFLGPYPIRILWLGLIGSAVFALLMVPWCFVRKR